MQRGSVAFSVTWGVTGMRCELYTESGRVTFRVRVLRGQLLSAGFMSSSGVLYCQ